MEIHNFDSFRYAEAVGMGKCFAALAEAVATEKYYIDVMDIGFNTESKYVYIAIESGVQIACCSGGHVQYVVFGMDDEEHFFDTYEDAHVFLCNEEYDAEETE